MTFSSIDYIIMSAAGVPFWVRLRNLMLTIMAWLIYFYFIQDFIAFLGDVLDWGLGGFGAIANYPSFKIVPTISSYGVFMVVFGAVFISWALYNQVRFRGKNRRKFSSYVTSSELSETYKIPPTAVEIWQRTKSLVMHHDNDGQLTKINAA